MRGALIVNLLCILKASEAWSNFGDWIGKENPKFGPGIKERFEAASKVTVEEVEEAKAMRQRYSAFPQSAYILDCPPVPRPTHAPLWFG